MEEQAKRSPGGKLALWALYAFCGYCVWVIVRYWWVVGKFTAFPAPARRATSAQWQGNGLAPCWGCWCSPALARSLVLSSGIHGPPEAGGIIGRKVAMLEADLQIRNAYEPGRLAATI